MIPCTATEEDCDRPGGTGSVELDREILRGLRRRAVRPLELADEVGE
jgi:hypothetical protein